MSSLARARASLRQQQVYVDARALRDCCATYVNMTRESVMERKLLRVWFGRLMRESVPHLHRSTAAVSALSGPGDYRIPKSESTRIEILEDSSFNAQHAWKRPPKTICRQQAKVRHTKQNRRSHIPVAHPLAEKRGTGTHPMGHPTRLPAPIHAASLERSTETTRSCPADVCFFPHARPFAKTFVSKRRTLEVMLPLVHLSKVVECECRRGSPPISLATVPLCAIVTGAV
jgi:hypothetical protein